MESGQQENQNSKRGAPSSRGSPWDQNQHSFYLGHLEQRPIDMCSHCIVESSRTLEGRRAHQMLVGGPTDEVKRASRAWCGTYHNVTRDHVKCLKGRRGTGRLARYAATSDISQVSQPLPSLLLRTQPQHVTSMKLLYCDLSFHHLPPAHVRHSPRHLSLKSNRLFTRLNLSPGKYTNQRSTESPPTPPRRAPV
jgi:hypothetical protein